MLGQRIGPYEVVGKLGEGGMGQVFRARDTALGREVALKVLPASVAQDPDRLARFRREAQLLAGLNHPNIAHVHGFEETAPGAGGSHALVMELVEGPTLADRIAQGPLPLDEALPIARQIALAMEAAHEQSIVHRDLKPANIKVKDDGTVKVLDFGLAKAMSADPSGLSSPDAMNSPTLTATQMGVILGTAAYMSPEQAKGRPVDRRADIWAFGVVLFEMLTGRRGYEAEDVSDTLAAVLTREVDWSLLPATTPPTLRLLVRDCLVRDPRQRLRDMGEARRTIERVMDGGEASAAGVAGAAPTSTAPPARRGTLLPWGIALTALAIAAFAGWSAWRSEDAAPPQVVRTATQLDDFALLLTLSPDGRKLAYTVAGGASTSYLVMRELNDFAAKRVPGTESGGWPLFSPDGQWMAFSTVNGAEIRKISVAGGTPTRLCDGTLANGGAWGPDDTIVFSGPKGLMRVPAAGGTPTALTTVDSGKGEAAHVRPQFLPGGRQILFTINGRQPGEANFAVVDAAGGAPRVVAPGGLRGMYLRSGHLAYVRSTTLFAVPFDPGSLSVAGTETPVVEHVSQTGPVGTADYAVSENGLLVYLAATSTSQGTTLAWVDRASRKTTPLPGQPTQQWGTGRLSPSGRFVANSIANDSDGRDVWIYDVERGTPTRVTFGGSNETPIWTPDSRHIIYRGIANNKPAILRVPADRSGSPQVVLETPATATPDSISPDGRTLVYTQNSDKPPRLMMVALGAEGAATGEPRAVHEAAAAELHGQISPDGRWIAYSSSESGALEVYVHAFPGGGARTRISTSGGSAPRWSRDGRELLYLSGTPTNALNVVSVPGGDASRPGAPQQLLNQILGTTWDVTPDANRFLIELTQSDSLHLAIVTNWFEELKQRVPRKQ